MPLATYPNIIFPLATTEVELVPAQKRRTIAYADVVKLYNEEKDAPVETVKPFKVETVVEPEDNSFPRGGPAYRLSDKTANGAVIEPWMHITGGYGTSLGLPVKTTIKSYEEYQAIPLHNIKFAYNKIDHITSRGDVKNPNDPFIDTDREIYPVEYVPGTRTPAGKIRLFPYNTNNGQGRYLFQFRGAMTQINPELNEDKGQILQKGLENYDKFLNGNENTGTDEQASPGTPTSPIHPFTRVYPDRARHAVVSAYNRTRLPISDIEHRKAFRYIFITRPECYLMSGYNQLCMQAEYDEDIRSVYERMPHVIRSLCPAYVIPSGDKPYYANWNYLLCNRVMNLTPSGQTLSVTDSMTKAVRGATVTPGKLITSNLGGNLELSFRDTKYMDVYETLRAWMWYIHKRKIGKFFPPFNGYQYSNSFTPEGAKFNASDDFNRLHPYDRALEYCCSIWDVITDETGMNILYWCKYYGLYPTQISAGMLSGTGNGAALNGEATISAQFQYQYKRENVFKNLVEFNYNAGIVDSIGHPRPEVSDYLLNELSYLNRENGAGGSYYTAETLKNYGGAASMFTGAPYIISERVTGGDPWSERQTNSSVIKSRLCFIPIHFSQPSVEKHMNLGITNEVRPERSAVLTFE